MRSEIVFVAMKQVSNRFLLARIIAKATRSFHRPGARIEDTTNDAIVRCGRVNPIADENAFRISATHESGRNRLRPAVIHRAENFAAFPAGALSNPRSEPSGIRVA